MENIRHITYRIGTLDRAPEVIKKKIGWYLERIEGKTDLTYQGIASHTRAFVYVDTEKMGDDGNLILHFEGSDMGQIELLIRDLENSLGITTSEMTEEQEDKILPRVLVK